MNFCLSVMRVQSDDFRRRVPLKSKILTRFYGEIVFRRFFRPHPTSLWFFGCGNSYTPVSAGNRFDMHHAACEFPHILSDQTLIPDAPRSV
ncbi:hypothetical protein EHQ12_06970 [Leptospira gomenensis]|uniref:Uncharacterized protein n=1 Tax=Leptospira gomenensis TaxID=2484974 RepID=A0A5F1YE98_9LEPT|nr:hypothetical protein EHQ17_02595 [Leptospira gomenensis]TGK40817.1 hypothetical protein EHQ12_06970 [Leptospira gomenensis]TGK43043.1 hypothetical protein EHQ07_12890 [Leptospira gomenensis]